MTEIVAQRTASREARDKADPDDARGRRPQSPGVVFWRRCGRARWRSPAASCWRSSTCLRCSRRSSRRIRRRRWTARSTSIRRRGCTGYAPTAASACGPYVRDMRVADMGSFEYEEDRARELPVRFFVRGDPYELLGFLPSNIHLFGVDRAGPHLPVRHRLVRARRVLAAAVRRADLADGRPRRHRDLVHARAAARRHLRLLRRLRRHGDHAHRPSCCSASRRSI